MRKRDAADIIVHGRLPIVPPCSDHVWWCAACGRIGASLLDAPAPPDHCPCCLRASFFAASAPRTDNPDRCVHNGHYHIWPLRHEPIVHLIEPPYYACMRCGRLAGWERRSRCPCGMLTTLNACGESEPVALVRRGTVIIDFVLGVGT